MGNCLVTKLKESVDNSNLITLGSIRLKLQSVTSKPAVSFGPTNHKVTLINGSFTSLTDYNTGNAITLPAEIGAIGNEFSLVTSENAPTIEIGDFYSIENLTIFGLSAEPIKTSDFKVLNNPVYALPECTNRTAFTGNWSDIINLGSTNEVSAIHLINTPDVEGDIQDFATWMPNCVFMDFKNSGIVGSIENYIQALRTTNRTRSNSITIGNTLGCHITFNGSSIGESDILNQALTWTENNITYNGVTINA